MARRGRGRQGRRTRGVLGRFSDQWQEFELHPETRKNILALLLFLLGIVSVLSLFNAAGPAGAWLRPRLFVLFGWGAFVLPFTLVLFSLMRLDPERFAFSRGRYLGVVLTIVGSHGLLHFVASVSDSLAIVDEGRGGGYLGWAVSYWLRGSMGDLAAGVTLAVTLLIGVMMVTNRTPGEVLAYLRAVRTPRDEAVEDEERMESAVEPVEISDPEHAEQKTLPVFSTRLLDSIKLRGGPALDLRSPATLKSSGVPYEPPPLALLSDATSRPVSGDVRDMQQKIQKTLEPFDIRVAMVDVHVGPTVTQFTLRPDEGIKLSKITALHDNLALALSAHPIRIEAPIPGKSLVGIEVPNRVVSIVRLREILQSDMFTRARPTGLNIAVGKDVTGGPVIADLERMPHLLLAGATGSGKSVMINSIIVSLLYRHSPATLQLLLIDPKRVELTLYNGIPHLPTPAVTEPEQAINALKWAVGQMEQRYLLLSQAHKRDIATYNMGRRGADILPYIVIVIDELADIMARNGRDVEGAIVRLAQMSRAVGLHLVVATQRPSVDVITGLIKANITSRIAFNVASIIDSRTILDSAGAEKLLGNGDMLFLRGDTSKPRRAQSSYVSEEEVKRIVKFLAQSGTTSYDESIVAPQKPLPGLENAGGSEGAVDEVLLGEAERVVKEARRASTSLLQRRLRIGYSRAARIIDIFEKRGIVGPADGSRPRKVLIADDRFGDSESDETREDEPQDVSPADTDEDAYDADRTDTADDDSESSLYRKT